MKSIMFRTGILVSLAVLPLAFGCGDDPTHVVLATEMGSPPTLVTTADKGGVIESASGTGHSLRPDGGRVNLAFNAVKRVDGSVTGQLLLQNRWWGLRAKMFVDCLAVDGNVAILSGTMSQHTYPQYEGIGLWFVAEDNGEGANDPPDMVTAVYFTPNYVPDPDYCNVLSENFEELVPPPDAPVGWMPLMAGNVQVKGG